MMADIASHNLRTYDSSLAAWQYGKVDCLQLPETQILLKLRSLIEGKRILDVGVGGGRTTPHLLEISNNYVGVDYSPKMIDRCKSRYPGVDFRVCDVRDLSQFSNDLFDFVLFSYNGIDYIEHDERIRVLAEIRRLLSDSGVFVFSSHNRATPVRRAWSPDHLPFRINPLREPRRFASQFLRYGLGIANSLARKRFEKQSSIYELRNDEGLQYALVTYYIAIANQIHQLKEAGYRDCQAVGLDGRWLSERDYYDARDAWIYYVCWRLHQRDAVMLGAPLPPSSRSGD
jgi:SAM-dependent methyltransferase